jgi:hypothetical protein
MCIYMCVCERVCVCLSLSVSYIYHHLPIACLSQGERLPSISIINQPRRETRTAKCKTKSWTIISQVSWYFTQQAIPNFETIFRFKLPCSNYLLQWKIRYLESSSMVSQPCLIGHSQKSLSLTPKGICHSQLNGNSIVRPYFVVIFTYISLI